LRAIPVELQLIVERDDFSGSISMQPGLVDGLIGATRSDCRTDSGSRYAERNRGGTRADQGTCGTLGDPEGLTQDGNGEQHGSRCKTDVETDRGADSSSYSGPDQGSAGSGCHHRCRTTIRLVPIDARGDPPAG